MVRVLAGPFVMGSDPGEGNANEMPEHVVTLSAFDIERHEVTNAEYRACVTGGGCSPPSQTKSYSRAVYYGEAAYDDYPVMYVTWYQAAGYCAWKGRRLPTEAEWEKAARGGCEIVAPSSCGPEDERTWPWGNASPTCSLANIDLSGGAYCVPGGDTWAVGHASPAGDSPYGLQDMAGNLSEWTADNYDETYYSYSPSSDPTGPSGGSSVAVRGGNWGYPAFYVRVAYRLGVWPGHDYSAGLGFRCARTAP